MAILYVRTWKNAKDIGKVALYKQTEGEKEKEVELTKVVTDKPLVVEMEKHEEVKEVKAEPTITVNIQDNWWINQLHSFMWVVVIPCDFRFFQLFVLLQFVNKQAKRITSISSQLLFKIFFIWRDAGPYPRSSTKYL